MFRWIAINWICIIIHQKTHGQMHWHEPDEINDPFINQPRHQHCHGNLACRAMVYLLSLLSPHLSTSEVWLESSGWECLLWRSSSDWTEDTCRCKDAWERQRERERDRERERVRDQSEGIWLHGTIAEDGWRELSRPPASAKDSHFRVQLDPPTPLLLTYCTFLHLKIVLGIALYPILS